MGAVTTSKGYAGITVDWHQKRLVKKGAKAVYETCQSNDKAEMLAREFNLVELKVFNFHTIISVVNAKLRTKSSQKLAICG